MMKRVRRNALVMIGAVDVWSIGCVLMELLFRKPLFNGNTESECLTRIFKCTGLPQELDPCFDHCRKELMKYRTKLNNDGDSPLFVE